MNSNYDNLDDMLLALMEYKWITYLPANRMATVIKNLLNEHPLISNLFRDSISDYRRDDFTTRQPPALSVYEVMENGNSRFYPIIGWVNFDIYLPVKLFRENAEKVFTTLAQAFLLIIQQPGFFNALNRGLVPLPEDTSSQIYQDVLSYRENNGGPLNNFGQQYNIVSPVKKHIGAPGEKIGDIWKMQIKTSYEADLSNFYAMIQGFGINFEYNPNEILYPLFENFSVETELII